MIDQEAGMNIVGRFLGFFKKKSPVTAIKWETRQWEWGSKDAYLDGKWTGCVDYTGQTALSLDLRGGGGFREKKFATQKEGVAYIERAASAWSRSKPYRDYCHECGSARSFFANKCLARCIK